MYSISAGCPLIMAVTFGCLHTQSVSHPLDPHPKHHRPPKKTHKSGLTNNADTAPKTVKSASLGPSPPNIQNSPPFPPSLAASANPPNAPTASSVSPLTSSASNLPVP